MSSLTKVLLFQLKSLLIGVSSLAYSWKANGKAMSLAWTQRILIWLLDMITSKPLLWKRSSHELAGSTCFTKLDGTSSYLYIVLNYESSLLTDIQHTMGKVQICLPPLGPSLVHRTSSNGWWTRSSPTVMEWLVLHRWCSFSWKWMTRNMTNMSPKIH